MSQVRKANAKTLADGYTKEKRAAEIVSLTVCYSLWLVNFVTLARLFVHATGFNKGDALTAVVCAFMGVLYADFMSGVAHWALDTWGDCDTPVFGAFIRSFREHHVNQVSITHHDYIETNGDNSMPVIPVMALLLIFKPAVDGEWLNNPMLHVFLLSTAFCVAFTNQAHKASHERRQNWIVRKFMNAGLIMSPQHHRIHHSGDFSAYYCITTGWLNGPLDAIGFWRACEKFITATTGAMPRADDKKLLGE